MKYLVSILIPTFNRSFLLKRSIESALKQSYDNIEIIISDNCSIDNTKQIVDSFTDSRIKYFVNKNNIGPILNWRIALERARGDLSIILCDDDYFLDENYIENAVKLFNKYNSIKLVITDCVLGYTSGEYKTNLCFNELINGLVFFDKFWEKGFNVPIISNVFSRSEALKLGSFKDNEILYSDIELWLKLMIKGDVGYINSPSVYYNFHDSNIVTSLSKDQIIKNSKFIKNINLFMKENNFDSFYIKKWTYEFIERYVFFTSSINNLKINNKLYREIVHLVGVKYKNIKYFQLLIHKIIRYAKNIIKKILLMR
jgi:glycosyltransferase involved in cell wall biosynthesis